MSDDSSKTYVYKSAIEQIRVMIEEMKNDHNDGWVQEGYRLQLEYIQRFIEEALKNEK